MKQHLIDEIRDARFDSVNTPSCEVCGFYYSSVRAVVKSNENEATLCLCEDCYLNTEFSKDSNANIRFVIVAIEERF